MTRYYQNHGLKITPAKEYDLAEAGATSVYIDGFVRSVLDACDGKTFLELYEVLNKSRCVPEMLLKCTLRILLAAGLLRTDDVSTIESSGTEIRGNGETPPVSVIILNHNGRRHLAELLSSLREQTYPSLEIIFVDNASKDDSIDFVRQEYPEVKIIALPRNSGFSKGNNAGIRAAAGEFLFILNNDTKLDPHCISSLVAATKGRGRIGAVAARMMLYDNPLFVNSLGNSVSPYTWGSDNYMGYLDVGQFRRVQTVFSACFGAALIPRSALSEVGLLDPGYRFYYEDTDWCYRARLRGYRIIAAPDAIVFHKFSASMQEKPEYKKLSLAAGSRLRFAIKNLELLNALWYVRNYVIREDLRNVARYIINGEWRGVAFYMYTYARLVISLPRLLAIRFVTRTKRNKSAIDKRLLRAIYYIPKPQMIESYPLIELKNIRAYYMHTGIV